MQRKSLIVLFVLLFCLGLGLMLYPQIRGRLVDRRLQTDAEQFMEEMQAQQMEERAYPELWDAMNAYNENLYLTEQAEFDGPEDYREISFSLKDYGLDDEIFGVISIPKLDVSLPLYLGATRQNMSDGAAQLGQTSIPIGGKNTNAVIAGHRGWYGSPYFLHINQLVKGDIVTVTNLWETLNYMVTEVKLIKPNDVESIFIREGKDMITLLSCHPVGSGGKQRYLVFCERIDPR